ncbi:MAG TPA: protoporphyrinogen oxidase, partial [Bacteroidetes bacterium]|nr:protoporphyrinogen oxidase [Bacteroidota bacterium]
GAGTPSSGTGVNGDYYLNTASGDVYLKSSGSWSIATNITGPTGSTGATGATGTAGTNAVVGFAEFYALMPSNNASSVAVGAAVEFPQNGPTDTLITRSSSSASVFTLPAIGTYMVSWQVSIDQAGQLVLELNNTELSATVVGRATGTSQISATRLITTTSTNSTLRVVNPSGNSTALTITSYAGGAQAVSASLVIMRIR